jgi:hypothetical protein
VTKGHTTHGGWGVNRVIQLDVTEVVVAPRRQSSTRRPDESRQTDTTKKYQNLEINFG